MLTVYLVRTNPGQHGGTLRAISDIHSGRV